MDAAEPIEDRPVKRRELCININYPGSVHISGCDAVEVNVHLASAGVPDSNGVCTAVVDAVDGIASAKA